MKEEEKRGKLARQREKCRKMCSAVSHDGKQKGEGKRGKGGGGERDENKREGKE